MPVSGSNNFLGVHPLLRSASAMCNKIIKSKVGVHPLLGSASAMCNKINKSSRFQGVHPLHEADICDVGSPFLVVGREIGSPGERRNSFCI